MKIFFSTILVFWASVLMAQTYTVQSVPNTKLVDGSYVSDPDHLLKLETVAAINVQLRALEDSATAQVAVVMLKSIADADIFTFSQELFNTWGLGQKGINNGLLILYVEDQRMIHFHTGDGLEGVLPDAICKQIQRDFMVPRFKEQNVDAGMVDGVQQTVTILTDPDHVLEITSTSAENTPATYGAFVILFSVVYGILFLIAFWIKSGGQKFKDSKNRERNTFPDQSLSKIAWVITYGLVPAGIVAMFSFMEDAPGMGFCVITLYLYFICTLVWRLSRLQGVIRNLLEARQYFKVTDVLKSGQWYWLLVGLIFPIPFLPYFFIHLYRKRYYRNYPRQCKVCDGDMKKLGEKEDDEFLSQSKQMEEQLKSGNYDVWRCSSCNATEEWFYKNAWSQYESCPKCKTLAFYTKSSRTVRSASYTSSGQGERTKLCKFCQHTAVSSYTIAQLERSTSSSSSSFGSSSSSSGGSWGGGSSSGGGASSSW